MARIGARQSRRALVGAAVAIGSAVAWPGLVGGAAVIPSPPLAPRLRLAVAPDPAGVDEALAIRVTGLTSRQEVTLAPRRSTPPARSGCLADHLLP